MPATNVVHENKKFKDIPYSLLEALQETLPSLASELKYADSLDIRTYGRSETPTFVRFFIKPSLGKSNRGGCVFVFKSSSWHRQITDSPKYSSASRGSGIRKRVYTPYGTTLQRLSKKSQTSKNNVEKLPEKAIYWEIVQRGSNNNVKLRLSCQVRSDSQVWRRFGEAYYAFFPNIGACEKWDENCLRGADSQRIYFKGDHELNVIKKEMIETYSDNGWGLDPVVICPEHKTKFNLSRFDKLLKGAI